MTIQSTFEENTGIFKVHPVVKILHLSRDEIINRLYVPNNNIIMRMICLKENQNYINKFII